MLKVNEIFFSLQGESSYAGLPCIFVRLTGCNLRCGYCDTEYAFYEGADKTVSEVIDEIKRYNCKLVEITGGEPLLQEDVYPLISSLIKDGCKVLVETNGSVDLEELLKIKSENLIAVMDIKCPSSGEADKNLYSNFDLLRKTDEVKFVISDREDYEWMKELIEKYKLTEKLKVFVSCAELKSQGHKVTSHKLQRQLCDWILEDNLNVRLQLQLHKILGLK
ncbi:MAG: radical SAM protein [Actinobacteria bacterium]|nr:radical SAM protein [Actinomycetota bacterium]